LQKELQERLENVLEKLEELKKEVIKQLLLDGELLLEDGEKKQESIEE